MPAEGALSRRALLAGGMRVSVGASLVLAAAGGVALLTSPGSSRRPVASYQVLREADVVYFSAMLPAVIAQASTAQQTEAFLDSMDRMLAPAGGTLVAIRQLVDLLTGAPGRTAMTLQLRDWVELPTERVLSLLESWATSSVELRVLAYHTTTSLVRTAWYMIRENQDITGYPGPPRKVVEPRVAAHGGAA